MISAKRAAELSAAATRERTSRAQFLAALSSDDRPAARRTLNLRLNQAAAYYRMGDPISRAQEAHLFAFNGHGNRARRRATSLLAGSTLAPRAYRAEAARLAAYVNRLPTTPRSHELPAPAE